VITYKKEKIQFEIKSPVANIPLTGSSSSQSIQHSVILHMCNRLVKTCVIKTCRRIKWTGRNRQRHSSQNDSSRIHDVVVNNVLQVISVLSANSESNVVHFSG